MMATNGEKARALDLENVEASQSEEEIRAAAQTDKVVRGVNGGLTPKARKLRPLAGLIIISLVVLAAAYMRHGLANRNMKAARQSDAAKIGEGPAISVENGMLSDQARNGLDIGQLHVPKSARSRSSITGAGRTRTTSIPPLEYRQSTVSTAVNGSLSFEEQRRLEEYNREREAMEAGTSVKGTLPGDGSAKSLPGADPLQAIQSALINARAAQGVGSAPQMASSLSSRLRCQNSARIMSARTIKSRRPASVRCTATQSPNTWAGDGNPPSASTRSRLAGLFPPCSNSSSTPTCRG